MATLAKLVSDFLDRERPDGVILDPDTEMAQAIAATRFYAGYAIMSYARKAAEESEDDNAEPELSTACDITRSTDVTLSEWAIIRPLFILYVERETALNLEASRGMGVDPYGRTSSEISGDITQYEQEMSHKAFMEPAVTV